MSLLQTCINLLKNFYVFLFQGIEIFCSDASIQSNLFLVLSRPEERDELYTKIIAQDGGC